jgi:RNA polymerase sigma-70 factor, ECF subfamily
VSPASSRSLPNLEAIFDEHFAYVWTTLGHLGVGEEEREDLVHDVFLEVYSRLQDYDQTRPIRPWLFGFAYRVAADHHHLARHRLESLGVSADVAADDPPADERIVRREQRDLIHRALLTIDIDRSAVLVMHDVDDVAMPKIARILDIPLDTAYSQLRQAREQLASAVTRFRIAQGVR